MEQAKFWLCIFEGVVIAICLVFTACKIFKTKITDWFPVTIWSLAACLLAMGVTNSSYIYYGTRRDNFKDPIATTLNTIVYVNGSVLFWEFSWGLFLISVEVQERLSNSHYWF